MSPGPARLGVSESHLQKHRGCLTLPWPTVEGFPGLLRRSPSPSAWPPRRPLGLKTRGLAATAPYCPAPASVLAPRDMVSTAPSPAQPGDVRFQRGRLWGQLRAVLSEATRCSGCALLKPPDLQCGKRPPPRSAHCPQQGNGENRQPPRSSPLNVLVSSSECCRTQSPRRKQTPGFFL